MKKALLFFVISTLTAGFVSAILNTGPPRGWTRVVEAQAYCNPPVAPWPTAKWPKDTPVFVKIQAGVFDNIEIEAIKAAFRAWHIRSINNCSNVTYPEPYVLVNTPPAKAGNVFYVKYDGVFTTPQPGITNAEGLEVYYAQTTLFRNMRTLVQTHAAGTRLEVYRPRL